MHDPMAVAHEIPRPWPEIRVRQPGPGSPQGPRWSAYWYIRDKEWYFPPLVTIWHVEPDGADSGTICTRDTNWRWHFDHWEIHLEPVKKWRRRIMTRCAGCQGRSTKTNPVNCSLNWHSIDVPWWYPEPELYHQACSAKESRRAKERHDAAERDKQWNGYRAQIAALTQSEADLRYAGEHTAADKILLDIERVRYTLEMAQLTAREEARARRGTAST